MPYIMLSGAIFPFFLVTSGLTVRITSDVQIFRKGMPDNIIKNNVSKR